jgi:hypothetical protein
LVSDLEIEEGVAILAGVLAAVRHPDETVGVV